MSLMKPSIALFTDLYELTMAQAYWQSGQIHSATFSLFFRKYPADRGYFVFAGLQDVLDYLVALQFTPEDIEHLRALDRFDSRFLRFLGDVRFSGSVRAMEEGTLFFINEPVIEVTAPIIEAQLVETLILNQINLQTILATKASRVVHVARGKQVIDFAARRTHGIEAANKLVRVAYLAGFDGTRNMLGGAIYDVPVFGTMAHSFVTCFESEIGSFRQFAKSFPDSSTFLVDSYNTLEGVRKAVMIADEMRQQHQSLRSIRLDSGDLLELARSARKILDDAGFPDVQIVASGGLDEFQVDALERASAPIDTYCVGTKVGVSADAPWTDCAYKLVEYAGRPVLKLSAKKQTLPGRKQVFRKSDQSGTYQGDIIGRINETVPRTEPLLGEVMQNGRRLRLNPSLNELRERFQRNFYSLPNRHKALRSPELYDVGISRELQEFWESTVEAVRQRELSHCG